MPERPIIAQCIECPINDFGGVEVLVRKLIEGLSDRFRIVLVSDDPSGSLEGTAIGSLIDKHIPAPPLRATASQYRSLTHNLKSDGVELAHFHLGGNYWWGTRVLNRCPMIHAHKAGIPVLSTNHGVFSLFEFCEPCRPLWLKLAALPYAWLSKIQAVSQCEAEIAVSRNDLNWLIKWYWPVKDKFRVLYHSKLQEEPPAPAMGRHPVILYVGTIGHRKGHGVLVKAFAKIAQRHPEWRLLLAGRYATPELYEQILQIRKEAHLEDRIELNDQLSDASIAELMRTSSIFVMPSLQEGLGLSLQEALYRSCACVASRAGGMQDLIEDRVNGLQVAPGNVEALADALNELISNRTLREQFSAAARPSILAKGMTAPQMVDNYREIYREILSKKSASAFPALT
jgi:glycosyltransferase involved in cell wall biosynthesis